MIYERMIEGIFAISTNSSSLFLGMSLRCLGEKMQRNLRGARYSALALTNATASKAS